MANLTQKYQVRGMHCAACAKIIEKKLKEIKGVEVVVVNIATEIAEINFDEQQNSLLEFNQKLEKFGYTLFSLSEIKNSLDDASTGTELILLAKQEKIRSLKNLKWRVFLILPIAIISIILMVWEWVGMSMIVEEIVMILMPILAAITLLLVGKQHLLGIWRFVRYGAANMDTLIGIGTLTAFIYSVAVQFIWTDLAMNGVYYDAVIVVLSFITLGKYLEQRAKLKTGDAIEKLLGLQAKTAIVKRDGQELEISIAEIRVGDLVVVKTGQKIAVDGEVVEGQGFVGEAMVTGESMPVKKIMGEKVIAGTICDNGSLVFRAEKIGADTLLSHIIKMVETAEGSKASVQNLADKISAVFVPVILIIAVLTLAAWIYFGTTAFAISCFVGVLVIACPCALGLATPTAIIVGIGRGAKHGILIKDADSLEILGKVNTVIVDKTGTLTKGKPELVSQNSIENLQILASLEKHSDHPAARMVVQKFTGEILPVTDFTTIKGKGISGMINGKKYFAGNTELVLANEDQIKQVQLNAKEGKTPILLCSESQLLEVFYVADEVKKDSAKAVADLQKMGIEVVMATGDEEGTAKYVAEQVGIKVVLAKVLPENKLMAVKNWQADGKKVAMVGDGINDSPALAQADVGIAMGNGTDIAIESAGITLLHGDITKIVKAVKLSRQTFWAIRENLFWAFIYNLVGVPLAAGLFVPLFGGSWILSPVFAGVAMSLSSVSVVANSLRVKYKKL